MSLTGGILKATRNADALATLRPMRQINPEGFQQRSSRLQGGFLDMTILYLPQLLGLAPWELTRRH